MASSPGGHTSTEEPQQAAPTQDGPSRAAKPPSNPQAQRTVPAARLQLRPPHHLASASASSATATATGTTFKPPPLDWMKGTWHVTHSTLPLWKGKRNVNITYAAVAGAPEKLDDVVAYQAAGAGAGSEKVKTVHGVDTPASEGQGVWNWRGKAWLVIATSRWEVLGWGGGGGGGGGGGEEDEWVVTYFAKTLFTPAGVDFYSRRKEGLGVQTVESLKEALAGLGTGHEGGEFGRFADTLFEIPRN